MKRVEIDYVPRQPFRAYHDSTKRYSLTVAHRRAGKTVARINRLIRCAAVCDLPSPRFGYLAPYFVQAKDIAWAYLKQYAQPVLALGGKINESELSVQFGHNGATIRLYGAENAERLRGLYFDGLAADEAQDIPPSVLTQIILPALADRQGWLDLSGTPKGWGNLLGATYKRVQDDPDWFVQVLRASQTGLIDAVELAGLRKAMPENEYLQEFECSFDAAITGAYFAADLLKAETDGRITSVPYDPMLRTHTVWDLGMSDSTCIWFWQQVGREIRVIDYYEASGHGLDHYAKVLDAKGYLYGKHCAPHDIAVRELGSGKSRLETAAGMGINFLVVPNLPVKDGIDAARMIIPRAWFDAKKCALGIDALRQYREKVDEKRGISLGPLHDWCFTGDTEVLTRHGKRRIMDLTETGEVLTSCGWKPYVNPRVTRRGAQLVRVQFASGYAVRCTPDHSFKTVNGWISAECLTNTSLIQSSWTQSRSILMAASIACGPVKDIFRAVAKSFTGMFGLWHLGMCQKIATSTTATETRLITGWKIWSACPRSSILWRPGQPVTKHDQAISILRMMPATKRLNGTPQRPAACGIAGTQSVQKVGQSGKENRYHANFAQKCLTALSAKAATLKNIVLKNAKPLRIDSVTRLEYVEDVWCISVPGSEEFSLANGALVHNCSHAADAFRYLALCAGSMTADEWGGALNYKRLTTT